VRVYIIHWFDDFAKSLARPQESRRTALAKMGAMVVAANVPWPSRVAAASDPTPHTVLQRPIGATSLKLHTVAKSAARQGMTVRAQSLASEYKSGPCELRVHGRDADYYYRATSSAGGSSLTLVVHHRSVVKGSGHDLTAVATDTIEVTSGGASVVRVESKRNFARTGARTSGTMRFAYGSAVKGISAATLSYEGSSIRSNVTPSSTESSQSVRSLRTLHSQFASDAAPVAISVDHAIYDGIQSLMRRFTSERKLCASKRPRLMTEPKATRSTTSRGNFFKTFGKRASQRGTIVIADDTTDRGPATYGGSAGLENQNEYGAPSTPNCDSCMNAAASQAVGCWETLGVDLLFGCAPCIAAAIQCQAEATASALGCWIPGAGCMQTICGPGNGCDTGDTCCGSKCCTGNAVCVGQPSTCCPPGYTTACSGANGPFCCSNGDTCCGNDVCCEGGSHCCGNFCCPQGSACCGQSCCSSGSACADPSQSLCCPADYSVCGSNCCPPHAICRDGVCCEGAFCGDQCCVNGQLCNHASGQCYYPSFGTPAPRPSGSKFMTCLHGFAMCHSAYRDGSTKDICCTSGLGCCAGTCCGPGEQCGGNGAELACGNWIH